MTKLMLESNFPGRLHAGKVRDVYELSGDRLLVVATDRVSAFDVVLPTGIPRKGEVLTRMSEFWFNRTQGIMPNHMKAVLRKSNVADLGVDADLSLFERSMVVRRAEPIKVECVVRGYLAGSGWAEYQNSGSICGLELPKGLRQGEQLPEPIFTPTSKAEPPEHDEPISYEQMEEMVGTKVANILRTYSIKLYRFAVELAAKRGILIADTKFEFGFIDGEVVLIDEVLTPDSSRFWLADQYEPGREQVSFDKQPLRDWLESSGWNKQAPGPDLPEQVVSETSRRYQEACRLLTGSSLEE